MKTIRRDEPISRSRFADCPVCKNHTLKVKRTVQVGRCKSCNETYKILVVFVKSRPAKPTSLTTGKHSETIQPKIEATADLPSSPTTQPVDGGLLDNTSPDYSGLAEALFGPNSKEQSSESSQSSQ